MVIWVCQACPVNPGGAPGPGWTPGDRGSPSPEQPTSRHGQALDGWVMSGSGAGVPPLGAEVDSSGSVVPGMEQARKVG
jgi:hypothetical protein